MVIRKQETPPQRGFFGRPAERRGLISDPKARGHFLARVPTTSISTRRFFALPSLVLLSATGCFSPLPSV